MPAGNDEELVEIAASLVPLAAEGCSIDVFEPSGSVCLAASHVDMEAERNLYVAEHRVGMKSLARAAIVCDGETVGELVTWGSRTLSPLAEALVCSAAGHAGAVIEARRAARRAREAEAGRDSIVAMVGHEVRGPLQALTVGVELVQMRVRGSADEVPRAWLLDRVGHLAKSVKHLSDVTRRLLHVSRLDANDTAVEAAEDDMGALVADVVARLQNEARWSGSPIVVTQDEHLEGKWDRLHVETVIENLLTNAMKYGADRPIDVVIRGRAHHVEIEVRDRGCGIAAEELPRVFDRFFRGTVTGHLPGLGVGLWIAKKLVEAHGGEVSCESTLGKGTTFVVCLPRDVSRGDRVRGRSGSPREAPRR